jgi:hypothetical protein
VDCRNHSSIFDVVVAGEHASESRGNVGASYAILWTPRTNILEMREELFEGRVPPVNLAGGLPLVPLANDLGLRLFSYANSVKASRDGEVFVDRHSGKVGIGFEVTVDFRQDLKASPSCDAAEILTLVNGLEHDHKLGIAGTQ